MMPQNASIYEIFEYNPIQLRYEMNWTLEKLAEEMGVNPTTAKRWSNGTRKPCKLARILAGKIKQQID